MVFLIFAYGAGAQFVLGTDPALSQLPKSDPAGKFASFFHIFKNGLPCLIAWSLQSLLHQHVALSITSPPLTVCFF